MRSSPRYRFLITMAVFLFAASLFVSPLFPQFGLGRVAAYSCDTPHCYNLIGWLGNTPGTSTTIYTDNMAVQAGSNAQQEITAETWLIDRQSPGCPSNVYGSCWIETGFISATQYTGGPPRIFITTITPAPTGYATYTYTATAYPLHSWTTFTILSYYGDQNFTVSFNNDPYNIHFSAPITNDIRPTEINTGQELAGSTGAASEEMDWIYNQYAGSGGAFYYQYGDGSLGTPNRNPPSGNWASPPSQGQYPGGYFYSYCC